MATSLKQRGCVAAAAFLTALSVSQAQTSPAPVAGPQAPDQPKTADQSSMLLVQAQVQAGSPAPKPGVTAAPAPGSTEAEENNIEGGGVGVREFQGDDVGQVLRLLAR